MFQEVMVSDISGIMDSLISINHLLGLFNKQLLALPPILIQ